VTSVPVPTLIQSGGSFQLGEQEGAGVGQVVDVEELAPRRAGAPGHHLGRPAFASWKRRIRAGSTWEFFGW
jgi:hypothetical protein